MKAVRLICLFFVLFSVVNMDIYSQQDNKIVCLAQVKNDSIVLRWVPASIPVWQIGVKYGYTVERFTIAKNGQLVPDGLSNGIMITQVPVKPLSNEAFDELIKTDSSAAIVQEAIYGADFQPLMPNDNFQAFMKAYNDLEVRFGFALFMCDLSPGLAKAAGLRFTDTEIAPDERYAYRVSLVNVPDGMTIEPAVIVLDAGSVTMLPAVTDVRAVFLDKTVKLHWPVMLHKGIFTAYNLEKSNDGTTYKPVSDLPLINASEKESPDYFVYTDSLKNNDEQTWYRVRGISPFGEQGPASEPVKGQGRPEFSAYAVIDTAEVINNSQVSVHWRITESMSAPVTGILITRASKPDGIYEPLSSRPLPPVTRMFTDTKPGISNYYKITLLGDDNLRSESFPYLVQTEDNDPPAPPQMLAGNVDSTGVVTIAWQANSEPDVAGYKVFRANAPYEEFISLGTDIVSVNSFHDTINLNTLTQKVYYKAVAIDRHYNNSDYSSVLELTRPDTISPAPALITSVEIKNGKASFNLEESPSDDISYYELYRSQENGTTPVKIVTWKNTLPGMYEDVPSIKGISQVYTLRTIDIAGNASDSKRKVYFPSLGQRTVQLKAVKSRNGKSILLSWEIPEGFRPSKTTIYRGKDLEQVSTYITKEDAGNSFEDSGIELNTGYTYKIRIISETGEAVSSILPATVRP